MIHPIFPSAEICNNIPTKFPFPRETIAGSDETSSLPRRSAAFLVLFEAREEARKKKKKTEEVNEKSRVNRQHPLPPLWRQKPR